MTSEEREAWLASLQVGDKVCINSRYGGWVTLEIQRITPTRQIKTDRGYTFKNGRHKTDTWETYTMYPLTDKVRNQIQHRKLVAKFSKFDFGNLNLDQLELIDSILTEV